MNEYIDKEGLLDALNKFATEQYNALVNMLITNYPTADVTEVVRCENCEFWIKQKDSAQGECLLSGNYPTGKWYCANGRRKEQ